MGILETEVYVKAILYPESTVSLVSGWSLPGGTLEEWNFEPQKSGIPVTRSAPFLLHEQPIKKLDIYFIPPESNLATTSADQGDR